NQVLKRVSIALVDEPGTLPGRKLLEADTQYPKYVFPVVMGNSDVIVGGRHPHTSASVAIMRSASTTPQGVEQKNSG
ncbi:MAG: hypothetical protein ACLP00_27450, partial [Terracidiphilus sp.]